MDWNGFCATTSCHTSHTYGRYERGEEEKKKRKKKRKKKKKKRGNGHLPTALFASPLKGASKARQFGHPAIPVSNYR